MVNPCPWWNIRQIPLRWPQFLWDFGKVCCATSINGTYQIFCAYVLSQFLTLFVWSSITIIIKSLSLCLPSLNSPFKTNCSEMNQSLSVCELQLPECPNHSLSVCPWLQMSPRGNVDTAKVYVIFFFSLCGVAMVSAVVSIARWYVCNITFWKCCFAIHLIFFLLIFRIVLEYMLACGVASIHVDKIVSRTHLTEKLVRS